MSIIDAYSRPVLPVAGAAAEPEPSPFFGYAYTLRRLVDRRVVRKVRPFARSLVRVLNSIPQGIYTGTMAATNAVAGKLDEIGDAFSGRNAVGDEGKPDFVQVRKDHYDYLERLRREDRPKYQLVVSLARAYKAAPPEKQDALLLAFFAPRPSAVSQEETGPGAASTAPDDATSPQ